MVMRVRRARNAPKVQAVLPPVLPRDLVERGNAPAQAAATSGRSSART